ncbi:VOC family protein [Geodermatophilus sp. SYSU D00691]
MQRTETGHVDHVLLGVRDLDATAARLRRDFGFHASSRAVIDGTGWANRAIPLGRGNYLELIMAHNPQTPDGAALAALVRDGDRWLAWAVCLDDVAAVAARAGVAPTPGSRGGASHPLWWTVQADPAHTTNGFLPFFITYTRDADTAHLEPRHTGAAASVDGIAVLELSGPGPEPITEWLGSLPPEVRITPGPPGIQAVQVRTGDGALRLA